MKTLILPLFLVVCLASKIYGQTDSIKLEVVKVRSGIDRTYYWLKDGDKRKYYTVCSCLERHKKGEFVMISKKDIEFIETKNY